MEYHRSADAFLVIYAEDPHLFAAIPPEVVSAHLAGIRPTVAEAREQRMRNALNWCVVSAPVPAWAAATFPEDTPETGEDRLWQLILSVCRLGEPDPTAAWRAHVHDLTARASYLTRRQFASLTYSGPGTGLTIGLPSGHVWHGGQMHAANGIDFVANLPTEEVFTSPHSQTAQGSITATRPFEYAGNSIEGMTLTFAGGKVVEYSATAGEPVLRELLQAGPGSDRLGEVALVPHSSPVSQARVVFRNILFDENAASHLALGSAFRFCLEGASEETEEQFARRGGNVSQLHYDFMIGSDALDVEGVTETGQVEPIMRNGEWAFTP
jgi:aminopeptidase